MRGTAGGGQTLTPVFGRPAPGARGAEKTGSLSLGQRMLV